MAGEPPLPRKKAVDPAPWRESLHAEDHEDHLEYRRVVRFPDGHANYSVVLTKAEAEDSFAHWSSRKEPDSVGAVVSIESRYVGPWEEDRSHEVTRESGTPVATPPTQGRMFA